MDALYSMVLEFEKWLNEEPYPESVRDIQRYWRDLKKIDLKLIK